MFNLSLSYGDVYLFSYIINHYLVNITSFNFENFLTLPMFGGLANSLLFTDTQLIQAIVALPFYLITKNITITIYAVILIALASSFWAMYVYLNYLFDNKWASVIGAYIFVFNPFIMGHFPDHLILYSLVWIPLIFLSLDKKRYIATGILMALQFYSSLYYFVFLTVIIPIYLLAKKDIRFNLEFLKKEVNYRDILIGITILVISILPFAYIYKKTLGEYKIDRPLSYSKINSAWISDYLLASDKNILYGDLRTKLGNMFPKLVSPYIDSLENNLFLGFSIVVLLALSFKKIKSPYWWVMLTSFLFTFGANGPYTALYYLHPLIPYTRAPARFGTFVFFAIAVIIAKYLSGIKNKKILFLVFGIIFIEYLNKPLTFYKIPERDLSIYQEIKKSNTNLVLDLPIGNDLPSNVRSSRATYEDSHYLAYALIHGKPLLNGYSGFIPSKYYELVDQLSINFPNKEKLLLLKKKGVETIVIHKDEYRNIDDFEIVVDKLDKLGVERAYQSENLIVFNLGSWMNK